MTYLKPLDGLRAIAVLLVIITHWFPETHWLNRYTSIFNGVHIFFCLSGFLITRILLSNKEAATETGTTKAGLLYSFYMRRFLRIFPIYYLAIFVLFVLGDRTGTDIRSNVGYFLTYTSNYYFYNRKAWDGILSHLWSLSVEEQFYLVWPWLILFLHKKYILPLIGLSLATGIVIQFYYLSVPFGSILTPACLDALGMGALLAWVSVSRPDLMVKWKGILLLLAISCFAWRVFTLVTKQDALLVPPRILTSVCTVWVINLVLLNRGARSSLLNTVLSNKVLVFIGKISYGIYLYHLILPRFTERFFTTLNGHLLTNRGTVGMYLVQIENFGLLLIISYLSWIIIERPLLKLKDRFEYQRSPVPQAAG